jgi:hypothetical protein
VPVMNDILIDFHRLRLVMKIPSFFEGLRGIFRVNICRVSAQIFSTKYFDYFLLPHQMATHRAPV